MNIIELPPEPKLQPLAVDEEEAARLLGIGKRTLAELRQKGIGPKHKEIGTRIVYGIRNLTKFVNP